MKIYLLSLGAGVLVGIIYALINVRSPAPPVVALIGLLGMLIGEQVVPVVRHWWAGNPLTISWLQRECAPQVLGTKLDPNLSNGHLAGKASPQEPPGRST